MGYVKVYILCVKHHYESNSSTIIGSKRMLYRARREKCVFAEWGKDWK